MFSEHLIGRELERIGLALRHLPGATCANHEGNRWRYARYMRNLNIKPGSRLPVCGPRFETETSWTRSRIGNRSGGASGRKDVAHIKRINETCNCGTWPVIIGEGYRQKALHSKPLLCLLISSENYFVFWSFVNVSYIRLTHRPSYVTSRSQFDH